MTQIDPVSGMRDAIESRAVQISLGSLGDIFEMGEEWFRVCARCGGRQSISNHTVVFDGHQRPTVRPSIRCDIPKRTNVGVESAGDRVCGAHYYITEGQIEWLP